MGSDSDWRCRCRVKALEKRTNESEVKLGVSMIWLRLSVYYFDAETVFRKIDCYWYCKSLHLYLGNGEASRRVGDLCRNNLNFNFGRLNLKGLLTQRKCYCNCKFLAPVLSGPTMERLTQHNNCYSKFIVLVLSGPGQWRGQSASRGLVEKQF